MPMSEEHKAALAQGRRESRAVKAYLSALGSKRPGRPVTPESLQARLDHLRARVAEEGDPLKRLDLEQEIIDVRARLKEVEARQDMADLEADFVAVARSYSERKGISYGAWRQVGVPASVLKKAGVARTKVS